MLEATPAGNRAQYPFNNNPKKTSILVDRITSRLGRHIPVNTLF